MSATPNKSMRTFGGVSLPTHMTSDTELLIKWMPARQYRVQIMLALEKQLRRELPFLLRYMADSWKIAGMHSLR